VIVTARHSAQSARLVQTTWWIGKINATGGTAIVFRQFMLFGPEPDRSESATLSDAELDIDWCGHRV
jgi:hypothetical protein